MLRVGDEDATTLGVAVTRGRLLVALGATSVLALAACSSSGGKQETEGGGAQGAIGAVEETASFAHRRRPEAWIERGISGAATD